MEICGISNNIKPLSPRMVVTCGSGAYASHVYCVQKLSDNLRTHRRSGSLALLMETLSENGDLLPYLRQKAETIEGLSMTSASENDADTLLVGYIRALDNVDIEVELKYRESNFRFRRQ